MILVEPEIIVGIVGLGGTLIGALAAFGGVVYQQGKQAQHERARRRDERAEGATDSLMADVETVRKLVMAGHGKDLSDDSEEARLWREELDETIIGIRLGSLRIPDEDLRRNIVAACAFGFGRYHLLEASGLNSTSVLMVRMCVEVQNVLGAYLRGAPAPQLQYLALARHLYDVEFPTTGS